MKYANRNTEYQNTIAAINDGCNIVLLRGCKKSGISSYLDNLRSLVPGYETVLVDLSDQTSFRHALSKVVYRNHGNELQNTVDRMFGKNRINTLIAGGLKSVPFFGEAAGTVAEYMDKAAMPLYVGDYFSFLDEAIISLLGSKDRVIVLADNAERIVESDHDLIGALLRSAVQFVFAISEMNDNAYKLLNYMRYEDAFSTKDVCFHSVDKRLVQKISENCGEKITLKEAASILEAHKGNIHEIVYHLQTGRDTPQPIGDFEANILRYLSLWPNGLLPQDLKCLAKATEVFGVDILNAIEEALERFVDEGILDCREVFGQGFAYMPKAEGHPLIRKATENETDMLVCAQRIFDVFRPWSSEVEFSLHALEDLFDLADKYNLPEKRRVACRLLPKALSCGSVGKPGMVESVPNSGGFTLLKAVYYCREREYARALELANEIPEKQRNFEFEKLEAILLNRTRNHKQAEKALLRCLENEKNVSAKNIIASFLISNCIHSDDLDRARDLVASILPKVLESENCGYIARNSTSLFSGKAKDQLFELAISNFEKFGDHFGLGTTKANRATSLLKRREVGETEELLTEATRLIEGAGPHHLYPIYNSWGIYYCAHEDYDKGNHYFDYAHSLAKDLMPRAVTSINQSIAHMLAGRSHDAFELLSSLDREVAESSMRRVKQLYYPHLALACYANGKPVSMRLIKRIAQNPDRYHPDRTKEAIDFYSSLEQNETVASKDQIMRLSGLCSLVYWYVNPLKALSSDIFSELLPLHAG